MSLKNWIVFMFGYAIIRPRLSADFCMRRYVDGKWISEGDCEDNGMMSKIMDELNVQAKYEKKLIADKKWTVFQRRVNGTVDFYRGWDDYEKGFGNREGNFWLGLQELHEMTKEGNMEMEIKMTTSNGKSLVAKYSEFRIGPGSENYTLHVSGYSKNSISQFNLYDGLSYHNNRQFSTKDADHDGSALLDCASDHEGGWWYGDCARTNLNGNFNKTDKKGIWWGGVDRGPSASYLLRFSEMKIRKRA